jgi:hypothetical protein
MRERGTSDWCELPESLAYASGYDRPSQPDALARGTSDCNIPDILDKNLVPDPSPANKTLDIPIRRRDTPDYLKTHRLSTGLDGPTPIHANHQPARSKTARLQKEVEQVTRS